MGSKLLRPARCLLTYHSPRLYRILQSATVTHVLAIFTCCSFNSAEQAAQSLRDLPRLVKLVQKATGAEGVTVLQNNEAAAGQEVFHAHFHVIPRCVPSVFALRAWYGLFPYNR